MKTKADPPPRQPGRQEALLANPRVRAWHAARTLKSRLSADVDLRKLGLLLERLRMDPEGIVEVATRNPERLQEALIEYAADLKKRGRLDAYVVKTLGGLRSYLEFRRVGFDRYPKLEPIQGASIANERVPSPEELGRVLERLSLRGKVVALFLAHTGVRPQVLGSYKGERGLTLGDLPDLDLSKEGPKFREIPFVVRVPANLSKTRAGYYSFGTGQLASAFLSYLSEREESGEKLGLGSPVISRAPTGTLRGISKRSLVSGRKWMGTQAMLTEVAEALHASAPLRVRWRPYVLRSYTSTRLMLGTMNRDLREAVLGHGLRSTSAAYNVSKQWGPELLAEARREYAASAYLLETTTATKVDVRAELLGTLTKAIETATGKKTDGALRGEDLVRALRDALGAAGPAETSTASPVIAPAKRPGEQRVVEAEMVERLLEEGWRFKAPLNSHLAIVEWPERVG